MSVTLNTSLGKIKLELFCEDCPKSSENFLALCSSRYYDDCEFTRVIKKFMMQSGDPTNTGKGGRSIYCENEQSGLFECEIRDNLKFTNRGLLAMANAGKDMNGSQFFITFNKCPHIDGKNTVFGKVIDGFQTVDMIEKTQVDEQMRPTTVCKIMSCTIHANPFAR
jgi:peptidyl-prolyl cis-trans isomerase-like 3